MNENKESRKSLIILILLGLIILLAIKKDALVKKEQIQSKPLVALMNYADYKYTDLDIREDWSIKEYKGKDYTTDFVEEILFSDSTYTGSDGREYMSLNKYYKDISGGKYSVKGKVHGWYDAKHDAKTYGANSDSYYRDQKNARRLVEEAIENLAKDPSVDLSEFDQFNKIDRDKPFNSPDGVIDTLIVVYPGIGEENGGGSLGEDNIWPFRMGFSWFTDRDEPFYRVVDHKGEEWFFDDFILVPQDFSVDNVIHEFGHILNLPDLYGSGNSKSPTGYWSLMSNSYTGDNIIGSMPLDMGAYCRLALQEEFDSKNLDANFVNMKEIEFEEIDRIGLDLYLSESNSRTDELDLIKVNMPEKKRIIAPPVEGDKVYYSGKEKNSRNSMNARLELGEYEDIKLKIKSLYHLKNGYDFFSVQVKKGDEYIPIRGNKTTSEISSLLRYDKFKDERNPGHAITGVSQGWDDLEYDLSQFAGEEIELILSFWTDNLEESYLFIDSIELTGDGEIIFKDNASEIEILDKGELKKTKRDIFILKGFQKNEGEQYYKNYYLLEWRNPRQNRADEGLKYINKYRDKKISYNSGLVIWYVDTYWIDQWGRPDQQSAIHSGEVYAGVVDADQTPIISKESNGLETSEKDVDLLLYDAAFSLKKQEPLNLFREDLDGKKASVKDENLYMVPFFNELEDYTNKLCPMAGLKLTDNGLMAYIIEEDLDGSGAKIYIGNSNLRNRYLGSDHFKIGYLRYEGLELAIDLIDSDGDKFYIGIINDEGEEIKEELKLINGKLYASEELTNKIKREDYQVNFIASHSDEKASVIYNSKIHCGFGVELNIKN